LNPLKREVSGMHTYWLFLILLDPLGLAIQGGSKSIHSEQDSIIMDWSIGSIKTTLSPLAAVLYKIKIVTNVCIKAWIVF
jgi:hypothetical protein